jgi:membrane protein
VTALMGALNTMCHVRETRSWLRRQLIAILVTVGIGVLIVIALGLLVIGPLAGHWLASHFDLGAEFAVAWNLARWFGAGVLVMFVWAILYRFLPNTDAPFHMFTPGAVVGVIVWLAMSYGFGIYLSHFGHFEATYGALGSAIIFLTWLWLSNIALLGGAAINATLAELREHALPASDPGETSHAHA